MPRFTYEVPAIILPELEALPAKPYLVFDVAHPEYELALIRIIRRGYGGHVLRLSEQLRLVAQSPPVQLGGDPLSDYLRTLQPA